MNKFEIQGSGFPGTNQTWRFLRDMINELHQLTAIGGDTYILKGCVDTLGVVSDGFLVYNGELLPFQGGAIGTDVTIIENVEQVKYLEDLDNDGVGDDKDAYFTRYAKFGTDGVTTFAWADLLRINPVIELQKARVQKGMMLIWPYNLDDATNPIPAGWQICDGTNGTPALAGMTLVQVDTNDISINEVGKEVGSKQSTPSGSINSKTVSITISNSGWGTSGGTLGTAPTGKLIVGSGNPEIGEELGSVRAAGNNKTVNSNSHNHTFSGTIGNNMQPSFAINYIMYVG